MDDPVAETVAWLYRREAEWRVRAEARATHLRAALPEAARLLRQHGARHVWLFGSLAQDMVNPESDIDLAVEGMPATHYFDALADLARALPCDVDLVRLEEAPPTLVERVRVDGEPL